VDLCTEALVAGCGFVARSFAGDAKQVRELLKAAMSYKGTAVLDIISPCVTFNNADDSTKSYGYGKEHEEPIQDIQFVPAFQEIQVDYEPGTVQIVKLHDGPAIKLKKLDRDYDPTNKWRALELLEASGEKQELVTGLLYINESRPTLPALMQLTSTPLASLPEARMRPTREAFDKLIEELM
jgi:2-oxoglutarate ferredoxin oxidoreductase subunit beta